MTRRAWEHDDWPRLPKPTLEVFDAIKARWPKFRVTMFGIPSEMRDATFADIEQRKEWMHLGVHGFFHEKAECREPTVWRQYLPWLDRLAADSRWSKIFKAPWHGIDPWFAAALADRGFIVCVKCIPFFPYPMFAGVRCACLHDHWYGAGGDESAWIETHPCYDDPRYFKAAESEISQRNVDKITAGWSEDDEWVFSEDLVRPLCLKINIGCGRHYWPGWQHLDNKPWHEHVVEWDMRSCRLPYGANKADAVVMSHALAHLPVEDFQRFFADVFRVLRPGAVFRFSENDCASGYIWRKIGESSRGNGPILSEPTKSHVIAAMQAAGFFVVDAQPGVTRSPHKDILQMDGRLKRWAKGQTFCVEAIKACAIPDIIRASHRRPAVPRDLRAMYQAAE